ncbi:hypothetical protein VTH82DRAFT_8002 [Thermothelomyces myriococcoides]
MEPGSATSIVPTPVNAQKRKVKLSERRKANASSIAPAAGHLRLVTGIARRTCD